MFIRAQSAPTLEYDFIGILIGICFQPLLLRLPAWQLGLTKKLR